jgi:periplasmic protein CpxP/Spy
MNDFEELPANAASPAPARWGRRLAVGGVALLAVATVGVAGALSQGFGPPPMMGGFGMGGFGGHGVERLFDTVDATPEQEDKIWAIIDGTRAEVRPLMRGFRQTREAMTTILSAPTIDRAAIEKLRAERVAAIDEASKKLTGSLVSAAEVLTPEQRAKLAEAIKNDGPRGRP